jgi:hypothetical protein
MSSLIPGQDAHARQEPGSEHMCGVFVRRPRGAKCRKTGERGVKWTQILAMDCSTLRVDPQQAYPPCRFNGGITGALEVALLNKVASAQWQKGHTEAHEPSYEVLA